MKERGGLNKRYIQIIEYLMAESREALNHTVDNFGKVCVTMSLNINVNKSKAMVEVREDQRANTWNVKEHGKN